MGKKLDSANEIRKRAKPAKGDSPQPMTHSARLWMISKQGLACCFRGSAARAAVVRECGWYPYRLAATATATLRFYGKVRRCRP